MKTYITSILVLFLLVPVLNTSEEKKKFTLDKILDLGLNNSPVLLAKAQEVEAKKAAFQASKRLTNPELAYQTGKGELYNTPGKRNTNSLSLSQYLDSQRTYTSIIKDYQESLYAWNITQAALEKAIGEGIK